MVAMLVTLSVMTIIMTVALPVLTTEQQRERETELVFRGQQYARAISLFQRKYGNALPPNLDVLLNERFLRKKYKDPITGDDFQLLGPGSPELALALNAAPATGQQSGNQPGRGTQAPPPTFGMNQTGRGSQGGTFGPSSQPGQAPGGIIGVASKSPKTSLRLYDGHDKYNEWVFTATQMSVAAGGGARGGAAGGAGGAAGRGGRGPNQPQSPRGRGGSDNGGRFGQPQSPFGQPQSPFGGDRTGPSRGFGSAPGRP
jgi:type II secretory pathway pseudopilin PulG